MATLAELEAMNMEDLRDLANQEPEAQLEEKSTKEGEEAEGEPQEGEPEKEIEQSAPPAAPAGYRRVIDLGDGSGTQVFEGATQDELIEKLTKAQENATRKIRELSATRKQTEQERADAEYLLSQELLTNPSAANRKLLEKELGMPVEEIKEAIKDAKVARAERVAVSAAKEFVSATPDYFDDPRNGKKISRFLDVNKLEWTVDNMKTAYQELSTDGLLVQRPVAPSAGSSEAAGAPRIAEPAQPAAPQRKAGSNLSPRGRSVAPPAKKRASEAELYNMDLDALRDLANRQLAGQITEE